MFQGIHAILKSNTDLHLFHMLYSIHIQFLRLQLEVGGDGTGCNEQVKGSLWRDICLDPNVLKEIKYPYLRACFSFLCSKSKDFKLVVEDAELSLFDNVAFTCSFLDD